MKCIACGKDTEHRYKGRIPACAPLCPGWHHSLRAILDGLVDAGHATIINGQYCPTTQGMLVLSKYLSDE